MAEITTKRLIEVITETLVLCEEARKTTGDKLAEHGLRKILLYWLRHRPFALHTMN